MSRGRVTTMMITLTPDERRALEHLTRAYSLPAGLVYRARMVLLRADGGSITRISELTGISRKFVLKWLARFLVHRIEGLHDKDGRGRKPQAVRR